MLSRKLNIANLTHLAIQQTLYTLTGAEPTKPGSLLAFLARGGAWQVTPPTGHALVCCGQLRHALEVLPLQLSLQVMQSSESSQPSSFHYCNRLQGVFLESESSALKCNATMTTYHI